MQNGDGRSDSNSKLDFIPAPGSGSAERPHCGNAFISNLFALLPSENYRLPLYQRRYSDRVCRLIRPIDLIKKVSFWLIEVAPELAMRRLAIDGKALRGVRREGRPPVMLNVYSPWFGAFISHYHIPEKSCELSELPKLLSLLVLKDAMATHPNILEMIVSRGGHAILPVKDNNRTLNSDLKRYMNDMIESGDARVERYRECESGHGRGETREIYLVRSNEAVLDERFSRYVGSVALVVRKRYMKSSGKESREEICYICDRNDISAEELHREIRALGR